MDIKTLVERAKTKDSYALATLYNMYYPKMLGLCIKITKEDEDTAKDLVHDAFVLAFSSLHNLNARTLSRRLGSVESLGNSIEFALQFVGRLPIACGHGCLELLVEVLCLFAKPIHCVLGLFAIDKKGRQWLYR